MSSLWLPVFIMKLAMVVHKCKPRRGVIATALAVAVSMDLEEDPVMYLLAGNPLCAHSE